jgi:hypothetical protein
MEPTAAPATGLADHLHCYLENLAALYTLDPELAAAIDAVPFERTLPLEPTRDGHVTVRLTADDGKPIYTHSRYQPVEEARTLVRNQTQGREAGDAAGPDENLENLCFLIGGLGLGYCVAEIERRFSRPFLIIAEDDLALIKTAFCVTDLSGPLRERRLTFLTAVDKSKLHERLRPIMTPLMLGLHFINPPTMRRYHVQFQSQISGLLRDFVSYARVQMVSVVRNARLTCQNAAFNLPTYLARPGIEVLARRAAGWPAIIVAAGPSLARNVDQLAGLRNKAVLIAVQTVLKTLLARGVVPHFVTSLDYHELSAEFFREIEDTGGTILIAESKVTWQVPDAFHGQTHMLRSHFLEDLLQNAAPLRAGLRAGSTVAHLAFYLAEYLGCDPVILVGQDLSFSEGLYYPPGTPLERIWQPELSRFQTIEMKQWERIVRSRAVLRPVKDIHGRDAYTDDQMLTYAEQFQADFLATATRVIHACEGGLRLAGTEVMTLHEAAERFCARPLPAALLAVDGARPQPADLEPAFHSLEERIAELREMKRTATETQELLGRLAGLVERPAEFNRLVGRVDELRSRVQRNERTYDLVSQVSQRAELRRLRADRAISDESRETCEMARRRLSRDREYVAAFIDGCDFLLQMLPEALQRARERLH